MKNGTYRGRKVTIYYEKTPSCINFIIGGNGGIRHGRRGAFGKSDSITESDGNSQSIGKTDRVAEILGETFGIAENIGQAVGVTKIVRKTIGVTEIFGKSVGVSQTDGRTEKGGISRPARRSGDSHGRKFGRYHLCAQCG